jgi:hypothetical protein
MPIRYLIDENLSPAYAEQLRRRDSDLEVYAVGEPGAPPKGTPDPDILCWCEEHSCLLVTNNRASMPGHLAAHLARGRHIRGILVFGPDRSMAEMLEELLLIAGASAEDEYQDRIEYLPVS